MAPHQASVLPAASMMGSAEDQTDPLAAGLSGVRSDRPGESPLQIEVRGVTKEFGAAPSSVVALSNVDLTVRSGEFVSVLGASGCGKSTLLMIVAGLVQPTSGAVFIEGQAVTRPVTDVGIVFQQDLLFDWRTIIQNVLLQAEIRGMDMTAAREKALRLLNRVGLGGFEDKRPWELSGGMRQRAAICRALLHDASVLLLDEPFGALDALTRDQMNLDFLNIWAAEKTTAVLVTHSISEAVFMSDRVVVMSSRPGRVIHDVVIDLPRPRHVGLRDTSDFAHYQGMLRGVIGH
jgi:NitT/TauT family transport system ATP-binding protein